MNLADTSYSNQGFSLLGDASVALQDTEKTLIVLGAPRGGTSALAGALDKLGVFMGDNADGPVYEDLELASRMERGSPQDASDQIDL
jgi:hypothetical protein